MNFLHPEFLWALLFLAIPVIVHLFNLRRYKKVFFSNTALLKRFVNETKKTSKLKKRILLLCRLLALFFIILAFVQPFLSSDKSRTNGLIAVSIYIDNSQSMALPSKNIQALEEAKEKALAIINSLQNQANYQILGNDFSGNQLQFLSYQEAIAAVKSLEISSQNRTIQEIWTKQKNTIASANNENKLIYWISDFQRNQMQMKEQIDEKINLIPIIHQNTKNVSIDTAYIASPALKINQNIKIVFKIKRAKEDQTASTLVSLTQNDKIKASKEIKWKNNNSIMDSFSFGAVSAGWQHLKIKANDAAMLFDNEYLFSFYISPKPSVTLI
ncbi:MAG: BatA domain-containing protein [Chitinophagales bacterium]